jgi:hypothetical protein
MFSSTVVRAELVSDRVIPIWVALSTTGIILLSIFQKPSFVTIVGLGGKIGNINACAPTCVDDVALIAYNPLDIQTMVNIAVDFSKREGYQLQPAKNISNFPT